MALYVSGTPLQQKVWGLSPSQSNMSNQTSFKAKMDKWAQPVSFRGNVMATSQLRREAMANTLHSSVDGKGLVHASLVPYVHGWVTSGNTLMSGAKFCAALGVRAATLPTRLRAARGRPLASTDCDCCGSQFKETLGHILNVCPRTHGA